MASGGVDVTVQRATFDRFNDATYADHHVIKGCLEFPNTSAHRDLPAQAGDLENQAVTDGRTLLFPPGSDIVPSDRIRLDGVLFQVVGLPKEWSDPFTGWTPGGSAALERVT